MPLGECGLRGKIILKCILQLGVRLDRIHLPQNKNQKRAVVNRFCKTRENPRLRQQLSASQGILWLMHLLDLSVWSVYPYLAVSWGLLETYKCLTQRLIRTCSWCSQTMSDRPQRRGGTRPRLFCAKLISRFTYWFRMKCHLRNYATHYSGYKSCRDQPQGLTRLANAVNGLRDYWK
jgi:hypothetical protein